jgi:mannose-6-phosphate isomerase-like protein (cupin superfamily)
MSLPPLQAGVRRSESGIDDLRWNILGQTYVPKSLSDGSFSWRATFPVGTFVPPHIHHTQDEFIYVFEGNFDLVLDGAAAKAGPGDLVCMPQGIMHGIFNKTDRPVECLFWVSPTAKLWDLFQKIHNVSDPAEVVRIAASHDITFLPPEA